MILVAAMFFVLAVLLVLLHFMFHIDASMLSLDMRMGYRSQSRIEHQQVTTDNHDGHDFVWAMCLNSCQDVELNGSCL